MNTGNDWMLVVGWAANSALGFVGIFTRCVVYFAARARESDPQLPGYLREEAALARQASMRRVWLKCMMTVICVLELAVTWDRWWRLEYDLRDGVVCALMALFLIWMLTWRDP